MSVRRPLLMNPPLTQRRHADSVTYASTVSRPNPRHKSAQIRPIRQIRGLFTLLNRARKIGAQRRRVPAVIARQIDFGQVGL